MKEENFTRNINYNKEFSCLEQNEEIVCVTIIQYENTTQIMFNTGYLFLLHFETYFETIIIIKLLNLRVKFNF